MQAELQQKAFLLKKIAYRDHDFIAYFLLEKAGVQKAMIRGGKKTGKASFFSSQPGDLLEITARVKEGSEWLNLTSRFSLGSIKVDRLKYFDLLFQSYWLELLMKMHISETNAGEIFSLLESYHDLLNSTEMDLGKGAYFLYKTMQFSGLILDWESCLSCKQSTSKKKEEVGGLVFRKMQYSFVMEEGGVRCSNCSRLQGRVINAQHLKVLYYLQSAASCEEISDQIRELLLKDVFFYLHHFITHHFPLHLKSFSLLDDYLSPK